ncbi:hypothetical protein PIB30_055942, partial [Stylosanthes scabra]|nr:hypothetical protein [Stylosanthes scabra]
MLLAEKFDWIYSIICGLSNVKIAPTTLYEDNTACIAQLKSGYIKDQLMFNRSAQ